MGQIYRTSIFLPLPRLFLLFCLLFFPFLSFIFLLFLSLFS
ncbi:transporter [Methanosarcina mazei]|uniref:Transporter n=1 Tax=Methanosarcina mazei TaxID=2209 RepID=A0A4P8QYY7_METMZ|nr:transporter [Methanosarcina mazei]QIB89639.1 transporter [Methanosarcina mazei]